MEEQEVEGSDRCTLKADVGLRDVDARMWHSRGEYEMREAMEPWKSKMEGRMRGRREESERRMWGQCQFHSFLPAQCGCCLFLCAMSGSTIRGMTKSFQPFTLRQLRSSHSSPVVPVLYHSFHQFTASSFSLPHLVSSHLVLPPLPISTSTSASTLRSTSPSRQASSVCSPTQYLSHCPSANKPPVKHQSTLSHHSNTSTDSVSSLLWGG